MMEELDSYGKKKATTGKNEDVQTLLERVRKLVQAGDEYWKENREAAENDLMFLAGEQWPSGVKTERENDGRPCLTNNVLPTFVDTVLGDQRQNKPNIKINPVSLHNSIQGDQSGNGQVQNMAGTKQYSYAETMTALVKNIEYTCDAESAYDFAFQNAVESGMGFIRVRNDYLSDDSFDQDILIENILNQFSVTIDPSAKNFTRSDAMWCFINDTMVKETFKMKYPDKQCEPPDDFVDEGGWYASNTVKVCEFYEREPVDKTICLMSDGRMMPMDMIEPVIDELQAQGVTIKRQRKVRSYRVWWRKVTAHDLLEGPIEVPCTTIPVIGVFGKMTAIKGRIIYRSIIRNSKDAQRMLNYWDSAATESVALAPRAPFIAAADQIEGFENDWKDANRKNISVLRYNRQVPNESPPMRSQTSSVPAAEITLAMNANEKIKATMGIYDASLGNQGNETSGKAIIARQRQGDRGSFAYIDNLSKAIRQVGKILIEMIPKIYDGERVIRLKFEDDTEDFVTINQTIIDQQTGEQFTIHDIGAAKYDVVVTTGPSYATQRMEAADSMIQFAQAVPNAAGLMGDLIAQVMDWPNADAIAKRLRKSLPPHMLSEEEQRQMEQDGGAVQQQPTPEQQVQMQELDVRAKEAQADAVKAESQVQIAQLKVQEAQQKMQQQGLELDEQVRDIVAEVMAEMYAAQQQRMQPQQMQ